MNLTFFSPIGLGKIYYCPFCGEKHTEAYSLNPDTDEEWKILTE